jgi:hypothetical protein
VVCCSAVLAEIYLSLELSCWLSVCGVCSMSLLVCEHVLVLFIELRALFHCASEWDRSGCGGGGCDVLIFMCMVQKFASWLHLWFLFITVGLFLMFCTIPIFCEFAHVTCATCAVRNRIAKFRISFSLFSWLCPIAVDILSSSFPLLLFKCAV